MTHAELWERHKAVMPDWLALYYDEPIEIVQGSGRRVTDGEGKEYLDFFAGILTNALGYDIAEISDAVRAQLDTGIAHTSTVYLIRQQIELAEKIAELSGIPDAKVFFTNSGTEANEAALLLATQNRRSQPGAGDAQLVPRPGLRHASRSPATAAGRRAACRRSTCSTCRARTATAARSGTCPTRTTSRSASTTCAKSSRPAPRVTSPA